VSLLTMLGAYGIADYHMWTITETRPVKKRRRYSPSPFAGYGGRRTR